jgi:transposase
MPWRECSVMDERLQFVARRLAGEQMADLCREFGISRKTGYRIFDRYKECGVQGLTDRSRRPHHYAHKLPFQVENYILNVKREHTTWGARKIRERLIRRFSGIKIPAKSNRCSRTFAGSDALIAILSQAHAKASQGRSPYAV